MADKDRLPTPSEQEPPMRPIHESEERGLKPTTRPSPQTKEKREDS